jgi:hypothetical protein
MVELYSSSSDHVLLIKMFHLKKDVGNISVMNTFLIDDR